MTSIGPPTLLDTYLERRGDLLRFLKLRCGSATEAEDLIQDLYLKVCAAGEGAAIRDPAPYLYRIATNLLLDRRRAGRRAVRREDEWRRTASTRIGSQEATDAASPEQAVDARLRLQQLLSAVEELPEQTRRVFRLHKLQGLSHSEVAAALGISRSSVEKHMIAVLRHLTRRLG